MEEGKLLLYQNVLAYYKRFGDFPTLKIVREDFGVPRRTLRGWFGSYSSLCQMILEGNDEVLFTEQRAKEVQKAIRSSKKFFISTAVVGASANIKALESVRNYCKINKAKLLLIPAADANANISQGLDDVLKDELIVFQNNELNSNLSIFTLKVNPKQITPTTGLGRIGQRNKSFILGSPKQSLEYVSVGNNKMPHAIMTPGSITLPAYKTSNYMFKKNSFLADSDHVNGGIIVEIVNNKYYHFRQVQFANDGSFIDLAKKYTATSVKAAKVLGMVLGDWHAGHTDPGVYRVTRDMILHLKPEQVVLHDLFNGTSINHHVLNKNITAAKISDITLLDELKIVKNDLEMFSKIVKKVVVVKSNHDEWIDHYLEDGRFIKDKPNLRLALELALAKFDGLDPLAYGLYKDNVPSYVKFLKRDEDHLIADIQCGAHSDIEGNLARLEKSFGKAIGGHSHTAAIMRNVRKVGTSTPLREDYAKGPISWTNTHAVINEDGSVQLLNIIDNAYKL